MDINFDKILAKEIRILAGHDRGERMREKFDLDTVDKTDEIVTISFPERLYSVNSSFFIPFLMKSIHTLGEDAFRKKYIFVCDEILMERVEDGIERSIKYPIGYKYGHM